MSRTWYPRWRVGLSEFSPPPSGISAAYPLFPIPYPLSFHILAHSLALSCTRRKLDPFLFNRFRTLRPKTRRVGDAFLRFHRSRGTGHGSRNTGYQPLTVHLLTSQRKFFPACHSSACAG